MKYYHYTALVNQWSLRNDSLKNKNIKPKKGYKADSTKLQRQLMFFFNSVLFIFII